MTDELTHTVDGQVQLVDITNKPVSRRRAVATGKIVVTPETIDAVRTDTIEKGDVLATARIGAVQAVKHTWEAIPMCHHIPITNIETECLIEEESIRLTVAVETIGQTGCEMEAIHGVATGLSVVWDMVKSIEKDSAGTYPSTAIKDIHVLEKSIESIDSSE